ncbi:unnamed protein product [Dibothriocephalus latus]|uniref:Uncharacterized protein n=1 Tax=Dibothriocephalus latus TaxID=60516 RepID=A0A3P7KW66_DIBLA|nr:unnamed protein product [Dibothriocephalus latus]
MPSGVSSASGSSVPLSQLNGCRERDTKIPYNPTKSPGPLLDNMVIPREYDSPDSGSSADSFEFPPDIPDGVTYGDLASHISNVVENINMHAVSKGEGILQDADDSGFKANGRYFDYPNTESLDSNPNASTAYKNSSPLQYCNSSANRKGPSKTSNKDSEKSDSSAYSPSKQNHKHEEEPPKDQNSFPSDVDDEFGDFTTFSSELAPTTEQHSADCVKESESVNDDFADFSSTGPSALEFHSSLSSKSLVGNLLAHLGSALEQAFIVDSEAHIKDFSNSSQVNYSPPQFWGCDSGSPANRLWKELIDHPSSLMYVWKESFTYSRYLQTVGVDLRSSVSDLNFYMIFVLLPAPRGYAANRLFPHTAIFLLSETPERSETTWKRFVLHPIEGIGLTRALFAVN